MGAIEGDAERGGSIVDSVWGVTGATIATLLLVLWVRYFLGGAIGRDVHTLTILGTIGGAIGALLMIHIGHAYDQERPIRPVRFWGTLLGDLEASHYTGRGAYAHLVIGGTLGPFCTWLAWQAGVTGKMFGTLPLSLGPAIGYALVLAVIGSIVLELLSNLSGGYESLTDLLAFFGLHLIYGITLGLTVGLYRPVFA